MEGNLAMANSLELQPGNPVLKNADKILFRASSMGDIMSGVKKGWDVEKSITCKKKLVQMYREKTWNRRVNKSNKYVEKGLAVEDDAITLYSRYTGKLFVKNTTRLENEFFTGEVDIFKGKELTKTTKTIDIKASWDWTTFPSIADTLDGDYEYQGLTYIDLTGADYHVIAYCLVNTPANLIMDEKKKLAWKMGIVDIETPEYIAACIEIEKNCIVDMELFVKDNPWFEFHCTKWTFDIPMEQRVFEMEFKRDNAKIIAMRNRVKEGRIWMNKNLFKIAA